MGELHKEPRTPTVRIRPSRGLFHLDLQAIWQYRELLVFLIWRDTKVRYKQAVIGAGWAVFQPLISMLLFTAIFSYLAKLPSEGVPYPLFAYAGLLPWNFIAQATSRSGTSLVGESHLISKVYFPRLIIPLAAAATPAVDLLCALVLMVPLMLWFGVMPGWQIVLFPLFVLIALLATLAVSLWFSALHVKFRDVGHIIPFFVQFWMFASPVVYPVSLIPDRWRVWYSLNPVVGIVEGFRWTLLGQRPPDLATILPSIGIVVVLFVSGVVYFKRMERTFADVI
ncbi:ABC transporter permease [Nitrospirales bacterium NOB]|nr:ABC transporter permease [Nitrospira sp. NTP2]MDL1889299.1 ABC transporter permease [Nitrospirales bacterium NOB]QOJ37130.1 MAG: ABC transporter permease [Nitrospira sp.]RIK57862.1 MAG: phosphate ABC transporter permease [Nitrospira sp.]